MIGAAFTAVFRKECLLLVKNFGGHSTLTRTLWALSVFSGGLVLPLIIGEFWLQHPGFLVVFPILGGVVVTQNIIDSVAGERERKTLETLLSTAVPRHALVLGKILPTVALAALISLGNLITGLVVVNLTAGSEGIQLPEPYLLIGLPLLSLLFPLMMVCAGFFGSLKSRTTRQATQVFTLTLTALLIVPPVALLLLPAVFTAPLIEWWRALDAAATMASVLWSLALVNAVLIGINLISFRRERVLG